MTDTERYLNSATRGLWDAKNPAPSLLLELTGKFGPDAYRVLPPQ